MCVNIKISVNYIIFVVKFYKIIHFRQVNNFSVQFSNFVLNTFSCFNFILCFSEAAPVVETPVVEATNGAAEEAVKVIISLLWIREVSLFQTEYII